MTGRPVRVVTIRTTHDGDGRAHGIVTGMGTTPEQALLELGDAAQALAQRVVQKREAAAKPPPESAPKPGPAWGSLGRRTSASATATEPSAARRLGPDVRPEVRFEVVDVRLMAARLDGGGSGWLAYGTLAGED
jgi:hypothetical protein